MACRIGYFLSLALPLFNLSLLAPPYFFVDGATLAASLEQESLSVPEIGSIQRASTLNGMGYIFYILSPLATQFLDREATAQKNILEIGAGFSNVSLDALRRGVKSYTANDACLEHLKILVSRTKNSFGENAHWALQRLMLLHARTPYELPAIEYAYDALLLDKVLHFMTPDEIDYFIKWAKKALKPQGSLYILTISPYIKSFKSLLPTYLKKSAAGDYYPGYVTNTSKYMTDPTTGTAPHYEIPQHMTFFNQLDLKKVFEGHGFIMQECYSVTLPSVESEKWSIVNDEQGDLVALIATKED